jgi:circadian clock protein KaiC
MKDALVNTTFDERCPTGIKGLDEILLGGLPSHSLYSVQGEPGSGKTTFALQFLLEGAKQNRPTLYITFSETIRELERVALSHSWDLKNITIMDLSSLEEQLNPEAQNSLFHPAEIELNQVFSLVLKRIKEVNPSRIVFDSVSEMRLLAETALRYRRQILSLKQTLATMNITVLFLDDLTVAQHDLQIHSIAHGVIHLSRLDHEFGGERRRLKILKLRGVNFIGGHHDMEIQTGGVVVHPRMISSHHTNKSLKEGVLASGSKELDLLLGGGLDLGTSTLFIGPAGTGKSSIMMKFVKSAIVQKQKVGFFTFDETVVNLKKRSASQGINVTAMEESGLLRLQKVDPAEMSPGAFAGMIREMVKEENFEVIVIDSLNGYIQSMPQENFLVLQLHELFAFLNNQGVVTLISLAQQGMIGTMSSPVDLTYLADTVVLARFFESKGKLCKALSVIKKRTGDHERSIRAYNFGPNGIEVGMILNEFEGILTGVPKYSHEKTKELKAAGRKRTAKKITKRKSAK